MENLIKKFAGVWCAHDPHRLRHMVLGCIYWLFWWLFWLQGEVIHALLCLLAAWVYATWPKPHA